MNTDHKKNHGRNEQQRHGALSVIATKQQQPAADRDSYSEASARAAAPADQEIKGKDVDLLNYTDL